MSLTIDRLKAVKMPLNNIQEALLLANLIVLCAAMLSSIVACQLYP